MGRRKFKFSWKKMGKEKKKIYCLPYVLELQSEQYDNEDEQSRQPIPNEGREMFKDVGDKRQT